MKTRRKTAEVKRLEYQISLLKDQVNLLTFQLGQKDRDHKASLGKLAEDRMHKKMEAVTKLIHAVGQAQEAITQPLSMLLDAPGF